jgi:hypothetical protein
MISAIMMHWVLFILPVDSSNYLTPRKCGEICELKLHLSGERPIPKSALPFNPALIYSSYINCSLKKIENSKAFLTETTTQNDKILETVFNRCQNIRNQSNLLFIDKCVKSDVYQRGRDDCILTSNMSRGILFVVSISEKYNNSKRGTALTKYLNSVFPEIASQRVN